MKTMVALLPVNIGSKACVNTLLRNGMFGFFVLLAAAASVFAGASKDITFPNEVKPRLIVAPFFKVNPVAPV